MSPEARMRLDQRRTRIRRTRRRVFATSLTTFAAAWGVIFFQLVGGHDPALSHTKANAVASGTSSTSTKSDQSTSTASPDDPGTSTAPSSPAPVTTSQS